MKSIAWLLISVCLLTACGGGDGSDSSSSGTTVTPPPASGIGSAGGTVNGPSGAKVVVPAGALSQNVNIAVAQSSTGAPALPSGVTTVGQMFALTPHGTQFATPVTLTIPFDAAATNGATPLLYKTNAQGNWETVAGATFNAGVATAQISSFSHAQVVVPPLTRNDPVRSWIFRVVPGNGGDEIELDRDTQAGGDLDEIIEFGPSSLPTATLFRLQESQPPDLFSSGHVFGTNNGVTYGALAESPDGRLGTPEPIGSTTIFSQSQSFIKNSADARLTYTITAVNILAKDYNPPLLTGPAPLVGQITFDLIGMNPREFYRVAGTASAFGANEHFFFEAETSATSPEMLWFRNNFNFKVEDIALSTTGPDPGNSCEGTQGFLTLARPIPIRVDISSIDVGAEFTIHSSIIAAATNRRGGGFGADCQASYVAAFLRDPASIEGTTIEFEGLTPTNDPLPLEGLQPRPDDPVECTAATNPLAEAGVLQFEAANFVVDESPNAVPVIAITRTGGATGRISAKFATSDGTATGGDDYTTTDTNVYFADGESGRRIVRVPVRRDIRPEGDELVELALSQPGGCAVLGTQSTATLTIRDDAAIIPVPTFTVGGSVDGLQGSGLIVEEVTTGARVTPAADGDFVFNYRFPQGSPYNVRIASNPTNPIQTCRVNNPTGTLTSENVTDVNVICDTQTPSGSLDPSFGSQGRVTAGLFGGADAIAIQSDGKIVGLGDMRLARYNADGSLDTTFGTAGEVTITLAGTLQDETADVAIQPDGKIVVVGEARPGNVNSRNDFAVARFNADGTVDTTFGTGGKTYVDFFGSHDQANAVLIQPDGRILAIGHAATVLGTNDFAVARLTSAGALDTTFDTDGRINVNVLGDVDLAYAGALQTDGAVVIVGEVAANNSDGADTGLVRLTANGTPDSTFGTNGVVHIAYSPSGDEADDVAIQSDGKIVIAGNMLVGSTTDFLIARLNADGTRDNSFGTQGIVTTAFGTLQDFARAVAIQPDGKIVAAGQASAATATDFGLVRLNSDGTFDSSFGGGGSLIVDFFSSSDAARDLALQADGKIVVGGGARNGSTNGLGLARIAP